MGKNIKVRIGTIETLIPEENLHIYINTGWKQVIEEEKPKPKTYNEYTKKQLVDIAKNRKLVVKASDNKSVIEGKLLALDANDELTSQAPSNKGFKDNLIIE